ncbi:MAG: hypothetical protein LBH64_02270 [Coriobacteriales bacterium]|nr:hypothetical protein [Coriobacteriales bacterium]
MGNNRKATFFGSGAFASAGITLVEAVVSLAVLGIVVAILTATVSTLSGIWNRDAQSRSDAQVAERELAQGQPPVEQDEVTLSLEPGINLSLDVNTYGDGTHSYSTIEKVAPSYPDAPSAPPAPSDFEIDGKDTEKAEYTIPQTGDYLLEVWGAQGGGNRLSTTIGADNGGRGGYSKGVMHLEAGEKLYLKAGGIGVMGRDTPEGGFNGGGAGGKRLDVTGIYLGSGGGASDVRVGADNLYARVIVAGGGGGAGYDGQNGSYLHTTAGGAGGGTAGAHGGTYVAVSVDTFGKGGTQTKGGALAGHIGDLSFPSGPGTFGQGGTGPIGTFTVENGRTRTLDGAGGGGGWYGGGAGAFGGGGGGSAWVFTEAAFNDWKAGDSATAKDYQLDSKFYLTDAQTRDGNSNMPDPRSPNATMTGCANFGFVRISWAG